MRGLPPRLIASVIAAVCLLAASGTASAQSTERVTVTGEVSHGADSIDFDPTGLLVTLDILDGVTPLDQMISSLQSDGAFEFSMVPAPSRTYFFTVEYQGARYSAARDLENLSQLVALRVFDATSDSGVLSFESYTVIVTGVSRDEGFVEILERARIRNDSDTILVFDQAAQGPAMLGFLRFALPPEAYNLDVRSSLVGGDVLEVDRGFALTMPVPPTSDEAHQVEFVYRLDYDARDVDLSRTMRFGAGSFRFVAPVDVARPDSPRLDDLGATELDGRLLRLLEGQGIEPGEVVPLSLSGLPIPSAWARATRRAGQWYVRIVVPAVVGIALLALLGVAMRSRRVVVDLAPAADVAGQRRLLLSQVATLEAHRSAGAVSMRRYRAERAELKRALVELELHARLREGLPE